MARRKTVIESEEEEEEEYEVESIEDHRVTGKTKKKLEYFIKWKNYGSDDNTWESEDSVANAEELVQHYWAAHGGLEARDALTKKSQGTKRGRKSAVAKEKKSDTQAKKPRVLPQEEVELLEEETAAEALDSKAPTDSKVISGNDLLETTDDIMDEIAEATEEVLEEMVEAVQEIVEEVVEEEAAEAEETAEEKVVKETVEEAVKKTTETTPKQATQDIETTGELYSDPEEEAMNAKPNLVEEQVAGKDTSGEQELPAKKDTQEETDESYRDGGDSDDYDEEEVVIQPEYRKNHNWAKETACLIKVQRGGKGKLEALVKWKDGVVALYDTSFIKKIYPKILLDYYESRLQFQKKTK
ncbi:hypothetical protein BY458DRAFT_146761 [Sporodiniella umbellata]|nr:hypothetical protein BY458DRAFT_146761 [Sporodiniella umbellata]